LNIYTNLTHLQTNINLPLHKKYGGIQEISENDMALKADV